MRHLLIIFCTLAACTQPPAAPAAAVVAGSQAELWLTTGQVAQANIKVAALTPSDLGTELNVTGRVTYDDLRVSHIFSPVTGRVAKISAQVGQKVKRGDALATIMSPDVGIASSDLDKAHADLMAAQADWRRQQSLFAKNAATQRDFDNAQDVFARARAEFERANERARLLSGGGKTSAPGTHQEYTLRSLIDGEVIARFVNPGVETQGQYGGGGAASELFTVASLDSIWVIADLYEVDLSRVRAGQRVRIKVDSYADKTFTGVVDWISNVLDPGTRTAKVRVVVENKDLLLKPDMFASAAINSVGKPSLTVPRDCLVHMGEKTVVFVEAGSNATGETRYVRKPVIVDEDEEGDNIPVLHGLTHGDRVVISGAKQLAEKI